MSAAFLRFQNITNSQGYQLCEEYLKTIEGTMITEYEKDNIINMYTSIIIQELTNSNYSIYIKNSAIPYLFNKYNIKVIANQYNSNISKKQLKTAPTLTDGYIIYVMFLILFSIFNSRLLLWIMTTIYFIIWRQNEINKYN